jgi:hypothetical protein
VIKPSSSLPFVDLSLASLTPLDFGVYYFPITWASGGPQGPSQHDAQLPAVLGKKKKEKEGGAAPPFSSSFSPCLFFSFFRGCYRGIAVLGETHNATSPELGLYLKGESSCEICHAKRLFNRGADVLGDVEQGLRGHLSQLRPAIEHAIYVEENLWAQSLCICSFLFLKEQIRDSIILVVELILSVVELIFELIYRKSVVTKFV